MSDYPASAVRITFIHEQVVYHYRIWQSSEGGWYWYARRYSGHEPTVDQACYAARQWIKNGVASLIPQLV